MSFHLATSGHFDRQLKRFYRKHPELRERVKEVLRSLEEDPYQPKLHLHALKGRYAGYHAVRVDYSRRIVLVLMSKERIIRLVAIGDHDEGYR